MANNINELYQLDMNRCDNQPNMVDLPDEILSIIFKKLKMADVLHSLVNISKQFDRLALDPLYIRDLDLTDTLAINSMYDLTSSIDTEVLSRICQEILPRIHHQVHRLTLEEYSMKDILNSGNYPQLDSLSLLNCKGETLHQHLTDNSIFRDLLSKQITHLNIDMKQTTMLSPAIVADSFGLILTLCQNLLVLNYGDVFPTRQCCTPVFLGSTHYVTSTLTKLKINVGTFLDCLILLDGRLNSLSTLIINVLTINGSMLDVGQRRKLPNLKCFSLTSLSLTDEYDDWIVPLLCRMINLEELQLQLHVFRVDSNFIDGFQLYKQFLIYLTRLSKFTFNITTDVFNKIVVVDLQLNEDIQRSFIGRCYQQVASYVKTNPRKDHGMCHIYSLPFAFDWIHRIDHSFREGMFDRARYLTMSDIYPFECKFFHSISQQFPFLKYLLISNDEPQKHNQDSSIVIIFPYLMSLDLRYAHVDYAKQFLFKANAHLPRLLNLRIRYRSLRWITNEFTNDAAQFNFCTLRSVDMCEPFVRPENFHQYFLLL